MPSRLPSESRSASVLSPPPILDNTYQVLQGFTTAFEARAQVHHLDDEITQDTIGALKGINPRSWDEMKDVGVEGGRGVWPRRIIGTLTEAVTNNDKIETLSGNLQHFNRAFSVRMKEKSQDTKTLQDFQEHLRAITRGANFEDFAPFKELRSSLLALTARQIARLYHKGNKKGGILNEIEGKLREISKLIEDYDRTRTSHGFEERFYRTQILGKMEDHVEEIEELSASSSLSSKIASYGHH